MEIETVVSSLKTPAKFHRRHTKIQPTDKRRFSVLLTSVLVPVTFDFTKMTICYTDKSTPLVAGYNSLAKDGDQFTCSGNWEKCMKAVGAPFYAIVSAPVSPSVVREGEQNLLTMLRLLLECMYLSPEDAARASKYFSNEDVSWWLDGFARNPWGVFRRVLPYSNGNVVGQELARFCGVRRIHWCPGLTFVVVNHFDLSSRKDFDCVG